LSKNPFEEQPPKFVRTEVYRLRFDEAGTKYWQSEKMAAFGTVYESNSCVAPLINYQEAMTTVYGIRN
jgi:hypothetical protein